MKRYMSYEELKSTCLSLADKIKILNPDEIVAVVRGGLTAAHIIAKYLRKDVGFLQVKNETLVLSNPNSKRIVIIEDLIAQGRTYKKVKAIMSKYPSVESFFVPILIDANYKFKYSFPLYGSIEKDWIVFPYEELDKVVEGDRGFFRDGSDAYVK